MKLIKEAYEKNLIVLYLDNYNLAEVPPEIGRLENLKELDLYDNDLTELTPKIKELKNLNELNLSRNHLTLLPPEIGELGKLTKLYLFYNQLIKLPPEIRKLKNLTEIDLTGNQLTLLPSEIGELGKLTKFSLYHNKLAQLPPEIGKLENLEELDISNNQLTQLPPEIGKLRNLVKLSLCHNNLEELPPEISELTKLKQLDISYNPLLSPPPEIVSRGMDAILTYLKQTKTTENNEAKLILVGNGEVGKTCLINRLITGKFVEDKITEGINISKWVIPAPDSGNSKIKLNIWDFGGQEIYHATHQFFLTKRSVYILVWNTRKTKDYDHIYYWLHTIEAFGEDSPIILVMSKMNESNDDLNLKDLRIKFPQIVDYVKIDSYDGKGIKGLTDIICETAWSLPLMRTKWVDSWFEVRQELEELGKNWISYEKFYETCKSKGLDDKNIIVLDEYLNDLGVTLHFKDRIALKDIVILKPEWATNAFYKILSTKFVFDNEGILMQSELNRIWDIETYPSSVYSQLMELMNKFELAYELPDRSGYLIAELLPKNEPDFMWNEKENLYFYYCYNYFLPSSIITRFIVRMHKEIEKKENDMPLCWREGVVLNLQNSRALIKMKPDEKEIEIKITGNNKRGALGAICNELDQINASIKKISVRTEIPCNCSQNCPWRFPYEKLLNAEINNVETLQCLESFKSISVSSLLAGYNRIDERLDEYKNNDPLRQIVQNFVVSPNFMMKSETNPIIKVEQKTDVRTSVNVNLEIDLPQIQTDFDNLKEEIENLDPKLESELDKIQDSLDEVSASSEKETLKKPLNKIYRLLTKLSDPDSNYNKAITGTLKGIEYAQKLGRTYNKFAPWLAMPQVPDLFLGNKNLSEKSVMHVEKPR
ncbi:hypothetical protein MSBRW_2300 [Methanosarcina barkeri str. Wiesmoor]|uniref:non-specific serine/threonine protein kinase n=2 Tax=Methanosarcina barkeri TaxID=2208 RepID=A0A0E3QMJ4_METBA|nr:hypothetical protein MSBRW_2300 [Methanosarcina barkeri str. Wiesmoor]